MLALASCSTLVNNDINKESSIKKSVKDSRNVNAALDIALQAVENNQLVEANQAFESMMQLGAKSPDSLNHYGIFLREQWRVEEARAIYIKALKHSPANAMTHWNLAVLYELYMGKLDKAVGHYKKYAEYADNPDKRIKGWVIDLERRIKTQASTTAGAVE